MDAWLPLPTAAAHIVIPWQRIDETT